MAETENFMPVELAIQRELAFRKKLSTNPLFHSHGFLADEFMPLQAPSSTPSTSANPNQAPELSSFTATSTNLVPDSSFRVPPPCPRPALTPATNLYPRNHTHNPTPSFPNQYPRPRPFPAPYPGSRPGLNFRPSTSGVPHQFQPTYQPRGPRPSQKNYVTVDEHGIFLCNVCQVPCTGAVNLKDHLRGHKHKAKLQLLQQSRKHCHGGGTQQIQQSSPEKRCDICQIWCTDVESLKMHLRGQKHQAKMQELENGMKTGAEKEIPRPWCELCNIWCMDESSYHLHLKGKKHVSNLDAVEKTKRAKLRDQRVINLD